MTTQELIYYCECGNRADNEHQENCPDTCSYCAHAAECEPLTKITFSRGYLSGQPIALCEQCDYKAIYWECNCDLIHDCEAN